MWAYYQKSEIEDNTICAQLCLCNCISICSYLMNALCYNPVNAAHDGTHVLSYDSRAAKKERRCSFSPHECSIFPSPSAPPYPRISLVILHEEEDHCFFERCSETWASGSKFYTLKHKKTAQGDCKDTRQHASLYQLTVLKKPTVLSPLYKWNYRLTMFPLWVT